MDNPKEMSRRAVLCGIAALSLGVLAENAVAATGITTLANGKVRVNLAANKALAKVGGIVTVDMPDGSSVALIRSKATANGYTALNLTCTHNGATVSRQGKQFVCPAHGATFSTTGKVLVGPMNQPAGSISPLQTLNVSVTKTAVTIG